MSECELCGRKGNLVDSIVEGSIFRVCENCSTFGRVILITKT